MSPLCQSSLIQLPSARLNGFAPVPGFTALPAGEPISVMYQPTAWANLDSMIVLGLSKHQKESIKSLHGKLKHMHHASSDAAKEKTRKQDTARDQIGYLVYQF